MKKKENEKKVNEELFIAAIMCVIKNSCQIECNYKRIKMDFL